MAVVRAYRLLLSPWLGNQCRFEPTCSRYALEALQAHGAGRGAYLSARRILRCNPWCEGGHDPVPDASSPITPLKVFSRLLAGAPCGASTRSSLEPASDKSP